jgi:EmrB/QacA subfamily drug resistance transporter
VASPPTPEPEGPDTDRGAVALRSGTGAAVVATAVLGSALWLYMVTSVNVAIPTIAGDLGAGGAGQRWIVNAFLVALAAPLLAAGALGDRYGRRRVFRWGVVVFGMGSMASALAPTTGTLIAARVVQGVGGAAVTPGSLSLIEGTLRSQDRSRAIGLWAGLLGVPAAAGPLLGGVASQTVGWRLVFAVPVGLAAVTLWVSRRVPESDDPDARHRPLDAVGAGLLVAALAGLSFVFIDGPERGWGDPVTVGLAVATVAAGSALVGWERRSPAPMVPVGLFRVRPFSVANAQTVAAYAGLGVAMLLVSVHLQVAGGWSPIGAGVALLPITVVMVIGSPLAGGLLDSTGPRWPLAAGPALMAVGVVLFARLGPDPTWAVDVLPASAVFGLGLAATVSPVTTTAIDSVSPARAGAASGVSNTSARMGEALGVAIIPTLGGLTGDALSDADGLLDGFPRALYVAAAVLVLAAVAGGAGLRTDDLARHREAAPR